MTQKERIEDLEATVKGLRKDIAGLREPEVYKRGEYNYHTDKTGPDITAYDVIQAVLDHLRLRITKSPEKTIPPQVTFKKKRWWR